MTWALPLPVVVPLVAAALATAGDHLLPRRLGDAIGVAGAAGGFAFSLVILLASEKHTQLTWFGGWKPRGGAAIGVAFVADPLGAGLAALASGLVLASILYSWSFLRDAGRPYDVLMLLFGGAMAGFALTGDIFNMFVWFELMGVAAYALAGFEVSQVGPLQGAINFAVSNTVGAYFILTGIALLYARTGALNLADIGHSLAGHRPDGLIIVALTLLVCGFLIKAAVAPFHLWLADAHAVAPAPVCVLFSGVMVVVGLLGVTRCYWTVFDASLAPQAHDVRSVLVALGIFTALLGAVMAFLQRHLKRLLAYSTISHMGIALVGVALLDERSLGGAADLLLAHGLLKASLFLCCGILLVRFEDIDELRLHGKGRALPVLGVMFGLGAVALSGLPYVGTYLGHAQIDEGAALDGIDWVQPLLMIAAGVSSAAILRAGARVFLGWGPTSDPLLSPEPSESPPERSASMPALLGVTAVVLVLGLAVSVAPGLGQRVEQAAGRARDRIAYVDRVLRSRETPSPRPPVAIEATTTDSVLYGIGGVVIALGLALVGLYRRRLPELVLGPLRAALGPPIALLRAAHSGVIGDYVAWITVGTAVVGGVWALLLRR
ncbi:MAG TPA: proton-conducting transporter membrane subunit [Gaiellaceae bacterium]|nr:proton-conducting transporter membrane subunit [Gaiellaceae bacterium]